MKIRCNARRLKAPGSSKFSKLAFGLALLLLVACSKTSEGPPITGPGGTAPFALLEIFLRPLAITIPVDAGTLPTPQVAAYNLTVFFEGGASDPVFTWDVPAALGELRPKAEGLGLNASTVMLWSDSTATAGFYDITVTGVSGSATEERTARFAAVRNRWVKVIREVTPNPESPPENLIREIEWQVSPGGDQVLYTVSSAPTTEEIRSTSATPSLSAAAGLWSGVFIENGSVASNFATAGHRAAAIAPAGVGRSEILFSSQMDPDYATRCPNPQNCREKIPFRLWVARAPEGVTFQPKPMTGDSSFVAQGLVRWHAIDYQRPAWRPTSSGDDVTISFLSVLQGPDDGSGSPDIWLADLRDLDGNATSDTLLNYRILTNNVSVTSYDWHSNGNEIYYTTGDGVFRLDVTSGSSEEIDILSLNPELEEFGGVSVYSAPGENTLLAFQAQAEDLRNLYVYDTVDHTITRVLPFSFRNTLNLWPSWHPNKKWIAYVSDYTVNAWSDNEDQPPLGSPVQFGLRRSRDPSVWIVELED